MRRTTAKYETASQPLKQGYAGMEKDLNDIGAQSNTDGNAYARLLTDPAHNFVEAADKFTRQTPGAQVEAIVDQAIQLAASGLAEKAVAGVVGLSAASFTSKYEELLSKMDAELTRIRTSGSGLESIFQ